MSFIIFNALKHHIGYIREWASSIDKAVLPQSLLKIGASQMDVYYGNLSVEAIEKEVIYQLKHQGIFEEKAFIAYINASNGFFELTLSDTSEWTLRQGNLTDGYIHIHPSRYAPYTLRVKAGILKTAIILWTYNALPLQTHIVNEYRQLLALSPIKNISESDNIEKMVSILRG